HPQQPLKRMLEGLGVDRAAVADWPAPATGGPDRAVLLREVMRPAATTDAWRRPARLDAAALAGLSPIDCATPPEEAAVAAPPRGRRRASSPCCCARCWRRRAAPRRW